MPSAAAHDVSDLDATDLDATDGDVADRDVAARTVEDRDPEARDPLSRDVVVAAAREMVVSEGLPAVSLRRLARRLGVTAPALYAYVRGREDLMRAVASDALDELGARIGAIVTDDPVERIAEQCRSYVAFAVENPDLFVTMFALPPELPGVASLGVESPEATTLFGRAAAAIEAAAASGAVVLDDDPAVAALSMWATMHGVATVLTMGLEFDEETRRRVVERAVAGVLATLGVNTGAGHI